VADASEHGPTCELTYRQYAESAPRTPVRGRGPRRVGPPRGTATADSARPRLV